MMIKGKEIALFLFLVLSLAVTGCGNQGVVPTTSATTKHVPTATHVTKEPLSPSHTPEPTAQPTLTPIPVSTAYSIKDRLACGETFCQVDWPGLLIRPISGEYRHTIDLTYPYAATKGGLLEPHHGVEFPNAYGTPVRAVAEGKVVFAGKDNLTLLGPYTGFYGNVIILHHPKIYQGRDLFSLYAHLSELGVEEGDHLNSGQILGEVGASGAADGSHLHFEIRIDENDYDQTLNPVLWFAPAVDQTGSQSTALAGRIMDPYGNPLSEFEFVVEKLDDGETGGKRFYPMTYVHYGVNGHPLLDENFVLPDLPPGEYCLAFVAGRLYEFDFILMPGSLGFFQIQLD